MYVAKAALALAIGALAESACAAYTCSVSTGGSINFLTYDPLAAPATASSTVTLTCQHLSGGNEFINWAMTVTNGSSGTCATRQMQRQSAPAATLNYNVYQDSTTNIWGNASCATFPTGTIQVNNGNPVGAQSRTMRGVLPNGQNVPTGNYLDTLVLTVTF